MIHATELGHGIDANRVGPKLWIGSRPPEGPVLRRAGFDMLVLCAYEHQPRSRNFHGISVVHAGIDDAVLSQEEVDIAEGAAELVVEAIESDQRVLVTCWMGKNRSGLVTALALKKLTDLSGRWCTTAVRGAREGALYNTAFVEYIEAP